MDAPWMTPSQRPVEERPWLGMAALLGVPLLALVLARLFWSGSTVWYVAVGIILLLLAAAVYLRRRAQEEEQGGLHVRPAEEPNRLPLVLAGAGVLFLLLLLIPNVSGGSTPTAPAAPRPATSGAVSDVAREPGSSAPAQEVGQQQVAPPAEDVSPGEATAPEGEVYIVQSGDSVWSIAQRFGTTVEALVALNGLEDPDLLSIGQVLRLPPPPGPP